MVHKLDEVPTALANRNSSSITQWLGLQRVANDLIYYIHGESHVLVWWLGMRMTNMLWTGDLQIDPDLSRTVVVSTKLDTRIPQFACRADVELFLRPSQRLLDGNILSGSPFFTSVPSGRVGVNRDCVYRSNDHFREVIAHVDVLMMSFTGVLCNIKI